MFWTPTFDYKANPKANRLFSDNLPSPTAICLAKKFRYIGLACAFTSNSAIFQNYPVESFYLPANRLPYGYAFR